MVNIRSMNWGYLYLWLVSKESFKLAWFCQLLLDLITDIIKCSSPGFLVTIKDHHHPHLLGASQVVVDAGRLKSQRPLHHQSRVPLPLGGSQWISWQLFSSTLSFLLIPTSEWDTGRDGSHSACKPLPPQFLPPTVVSPEIKFCLEKKRKYKFFHIPSHLLVSISDCR